MFAEKKFEDIIEDGKLIAIAKLPFISMELADMILQEKEGIGTMATDSKSVIYFDPKFEEMVDDAVKMNLSNKQYYLALVITHEIFHKIQKDNIFFRMIGEGGIHELYNIAADSYINDIILEFFQTTGILGNEAVNAFRDRCVTTRSLLDTIKEYDTRNQIKISYEELSLCTTVERYNLLLKASEENREMMQSIIDDIMEKIGGMDIMPGDGDGGPMDGTSGSEGITIPADIADAVKSGMIKATTAMLNKINSIGKSSSNFEQIVGGLLEPKVDWKSKLARIIRNCGQRIETSEEEEEINKRLTHIHGFTFKDFYSYTPKIIIGLDTSGSMGGLHDQCAAEIAKINKDREIRLIEIDTEIKQDYTVKNGEIEKAIKNAKFGISGYGGTQMAPFYQLLLEEKAEGNVVILMSDYELFGDDFEHIEDISRKLKKYNNGFIHCHLGRDGEVEISTNVMDFKRHAW